jgi:hypothetical protein
LALATDFSPHSYAANNPHVISDPSYSHTFPASITSCGPFSGAVDDERRDDQWRGTRTFPGCKTHRRATDNTYHPAPETSDITAFPDLRRAKKKTPFNGGLRDRWINAKGRIIYEWDYLHGELEAYRASDGSHLGSYDHRTGEQIDPPKKNRSIKKYL